LSHAQEAPTALWPEAQGCRVAATLGNRLRQKHQGQRRCGRTWPQPDPFRVVMYLRSKPNLAALPQRRAGFSPLQCTKGSTRLKNRERVACQELKRREPCLSCFAEEECFGRRPKTADETSCPPSTHQSAWPTR
jgi:hypothetical protein